MTTNTIFLNFHWWEIKVFVERTVLTGEKMKKMSDFSIQDKTSKGLSGKHFEDLIAEMRRQISLMDKRIDDLEKTKS